ncbi:hypothetical protein HYR99_17705 [Candidatus Poribacteria bacterium]|nr:hypothetical protein [Candidatus Poribacteria bacterium]
MVNRNNILLRLSQSILNLQLPHPVRVGIDGVTACGKSTLARELAGILRESGRECLLASMDGFHNPRGIRYRQGRESAKGYYYDAYNYQKVRELLLLPLGPGGNFSYRTEIFDHVNDRPVDQPARLANQDDILILEGSFTFKNEILKHLDYKIYIYTDFEAALERGVARDSKKIFGSEEEARKIIRKRYHGAHQIHFHVVQPMKKANVVINNNDFLNPILTYCDSSAIAFSV